MYFKQSKNITSAELDNEICIFNPIEGKYLNLNNSASEIWKSLENSIKLEDIVENMNIYEIDKTICKRRLKIF